MSSSFQHTRRAVYRIVYPVPQRPSLQIGAETFPVIDCSELGLRYQVPDAYVPTLGSTVSGTVQFRRGAAVPVTGEVVRVERGTVALWFRSEAIPLGEILQERQYVESADQANREDSE
jgi:hypothetical protein